ncbi:amidase [Ruegeria halocynthiae]|uniref:Amidase n=1 Tax=Ruegeria halocynthiae TaxID=985054 RepID=A0A1H3EF14_9RHOB|nr:amidase [Ruegeria halocynthiae]SDX76514.1 amidase [Ruegeria halocynthiae]
MLLHQNTATQIVAKLNAGHLSASQVAQNQLDRIRRLDPVINAIVATDDKQQNDVMGALAGLPITLKDQIHHPAMVCTFGSTQHKDFRPAQTAPVVERLLSAGAHVIGKTNLPPLAMDFQCSNPLFGTTNNPWDLSYTTGGSSGGGAAAVAAGLSFLDLGTDLSGSLRIPASFCGVFSLLPTENALPNEGMMANGAPPLRHFARMGPIARTPEDLDLAWTHMSEPSDEIQMEFAMPRVFWSVDGDGVDVSDDITGCIAKASTAWAKFGVQVSRSQPKNFDFKRARRAFGEIMGFETGELLSASVRLLTRFFGRASARRSPEFITNIMLGYRHNQKRYDAALTEKRILSAALDASLGDNGVWVLPVTATSAFKHIAPTSDHNGVRDYANPLVINGKPANYFDALTSFVTPISLTGHPVVIIPLGLDKNGMPVGAQLVGKKGWEKHLIQTAKVLCELLETTDCPMLIRK